MRVALGRPLALGMLLGASGTLHAAGFHAGLNARGELIVSDQPATGLIAFDPYARRMSHPADRGPRARTEPLDSLLERAAAESGVDRALLHAVVQPGVRIQSAGRIARRCSRPDAADARHGAALRRPRSV